VIEPDAMSKMEGLSIDYWLAVLKAAEKTNSTHITAPYSRETIPVNTPSPPIYNIYGEETANVFGNPSGVANSQLHYGTDQAIFIESQPLYRGGIVWDFQQTLIGEVAQINLPTTSSDRVINEGTWRITA
jgi:hypothetical protein